ncbi:uncharacterized protein N7515_001634 [Penicillium bovifimosum]|uniref:HNH nuclease domain-containing protein n=1 Tax=Penicillium bovifimosum TaxID=126998 RepID=A0A9W9L8Y4_9EURO|nr:uncharacterized protein N7515_001634 [Penicillium bovifimosum]KAJ5142847.1 hypothetical protein N7515_001634 [Penicillium bovifimosum]
MSRPTWMGIGRTSSKDWHRGRTTFRTLVVFLLNSYRYQGLENEPLGGLHNCPERLAELLTDLRSVLTTLVRKQSETPVLYNAIVGASDTSGTTELLAAEEPSHHSWARACTSTNRADPTPLDLIMDSPTSEMSSSSLSSPVSETQFDTYIAAREKIFARLDKYQSLDDYDDTVHFLRSVFRFLPTQGQARLANDVEDCDEDSQLLQLAKHLDTALLRPMLVAGGTTPEITPSPIHGVEDSIEDPLSLDFDSATRRQSAIRRTCLQRDNYQCVVTKAWDREHNPPPGALTGVLEAVHIIPFALGSFPEDERRRHGRIWQCLYRYFPAIRDLFHRDDEDVNRIDNVMMMWSALHRDFGSFLLVLEETSVSGRYRVKTFPRFQTILQSIMPDFTTIASHDPQYPAPHSSLLAVHAAIGNILHATGRGELIEKTMQHLRDNGGHVLANDGSTDVEELLSVTGLSLLVANPSYCSSVCKETYPRGYDTPPGGD